MLALQVAVPATMLVVRQSDGVRATEELPASWQMYSYAPAPVYVGNRPDGSAVPLESPSIVATGTRGPRLLCAREDVVSVVRVGGLDPMLYPC